MRRTTEKEAERILYDELLEKIYAIADTALVKKSEVKKVMEVFNNVKET